MDLRKRQTFIYRNDVGVTEGRHDLNLPTDVHHVLLIFDFFLLNGLNRNL